MGLNLIKCFCPTKEIINKMKRQSREGNKTFTNYLSDKGLLSNYIKNSYNSIAKNHKQSD